MKTLSLSGLHGFLVVDASTGEVISTTDCEECLPQKNCAAYKYVKKVDIAQIVKDFGAVPDSEDILSVGYWYDEDGVEKYTPPAPGFVEWRTNANKKQVV